MCCRTQHILCHHIQQQQQLPNSSRLCWMWGDPDIHDLTSMHKKHIER